MNRFLFGLRFAAGVLAVGALSAVGLTCALIGEVLESIESACISAIDKEMTEMLARVEGGR